MPQRMTVPPADPNEERRAWAEAYADMLYIGDHIDEKAPFLLPGEHVDVFRAAWWDVRSDLERIVGALSPAPTSPAPTNVGPGTPDVKPPPITIEQLNAAKLTGPHGAQKRSLLARMRDGFLGFFISEPVTEEKLKNAAEEGERYFDFSAVVTSSLATCVREIQGMEAACKALEEGFLGIKHLLGMRGKRGY